METVRLTRYASGGGCACKIPPGELENLVAGLARTPEDGSLLVGAEDGDDAAVVSLKSGPVLVTAVDLSHRSSMTRTTSAGSPSTAVPYLEGAREAARDGHISGGTRRNHEWVRLGWLIWTSGGSSPPWSSMVGEAS
jgi:selenophosphate synthase